MPNPKLGTVTKEVAKAVKTAKGSVQYRVEKHGIIQVSVGKVSFSKENLIDNIRAVMLSIQETKPEGLKGKFMLKAHISSTMGPGVLLDLKSVDPTSPRFMLDPTKL